MHTLIAHTSLHYHSKPLDMYTDTDRHSHRHTQPQTTGTTKYAGLQHSLSFRCTQASVTAAHNTYQDLANGLGKGYCSIVEVAFPVCRQSHQQLAVIATAEVCMTQQYLHDTNIRLYLHRACFCSLRLTVQRQSAGCDVACMVLMACQDYDQNSCLALLSTACFMLSSLCHDASLCFATCCRCARLRPSLQALPS